MKFRVQTKSAKPAWLVHLLVGLGLATLLCACGGGGSAAPSEKVSEVLAPSSTLANRCAVPRVNSIDRQGTVEIEKAYLRSFVDETYLWYRDVPTNLIAANYRTPQDYFNVLKTNARTASGVPVDQFHWSMTTQSWNEASSGQVHDYGIEWHLLAGSPPRALVVAEVAPGSPADLAGIQRGDRVTSVDGVDFVNDGTEAGLAVIKEGLFPTVDAPHRLGFKSAGEQTITPASYQTTTVQKVKTFATPRGTVGYFVFDSHLSQSERELIAAINQLKQANVSDLVIDMRYNGGGLIYIASELAYMIAGPTVTSRKVFEQLTHNDKQAAQNKIFPFYGYGTQDQALPHLDLSHVTLLVGRGTASASESVINGLRGINVTVDLVGTTTRGKPYGFVPQDNCGYTYFAIQFKGVNNKGFGDYADGFAPTCAVTDDFSHQRGDPAEGMLSAALNYRLSQQCPPSNSAALLNPVTGADFQVLRPPIKEMRILTPMPKL